MVDMAHIAGLVAAGEHPSPVPYADVVTTTTHKTLRGPRGGMILCKEKYAKAIDKAIFPGTQGGPLDARDRGQGCLPQGSAWVLSLRHISIRSSSMRRAMAEEFTEKAFDLVSGGTDNHLMLLDLTEHRCDGQGAGSLARTSATLLSIKIPFPRKRCSPFVTSGVRIGTPAVTTRGMKEPEMKRIAALITHVIREGEGCLPRS